MNSMKISKNVINLSNAQNCYTCLLPGKSILILLASFIKIITSKCTFYRQFQRIFFCCLTKSPEKFSATRASKEIVNINCAHYTSVTFYDKKRSCKHSLCCNRVNVIYFVFDCKKASIYLKVIYSCKESLAIYVVCIYYTKPLVYLR